MTKISEAKQIRLAEKYNRMVQFEQTMLMRGFHRIAGIDEAGRGPLAGPVVAAACILDPHVPIYGLDDSKKLSEKKREELFEEILEKALGWSVAMVDAGEIDRINILEATKQAMLSAIEKMQMRPDILLIDAVRLDAAAIPFEAIIKGDARSVSIAAASILAKVSRDRLMKTYDQYYPGYGFAGHKGYGTQAHYAAIKTLGICPIHRRTFLKKILDPE